MKYEGYFGKSLENFFNHGTYSRISEIRILELLLAFILVIQKQDFTMRTSIALIWVERWI